MSGFDDAEISQRRGSPVEVYEFTYQAQSTFWTSAAEPQARGGTTYKPYAMQRAAISSNGASVEQTLTVTAEQDFPPAQLFKVQAPSAVVNLKILRKHISDVTNSYGTIWIGRVLSAKWTNESKVELLCETDLASLKRLGLRRRYQLNCPWDLYGDGCNISAASFGVVVTSFSAIGRLVTIPALVTAPDNKFAGGYLVYPNALTGINEIITIRTSASGVMSCALTPFGIEAADTMTVYPGCDHTMTVCTDEFNNLPNHGGTPLIPGINPYAGTQIY